MKTKDLYRILIGEPAHWNREIAVELYVKSRGRNKFRVVLGHVAGLETDPKNPSKLTLRIKEGKE